MDKDGSAGGLVDDEALDAAYLHALIQAFLDALQAYDDAVKAGLRVHSYREIEDRAIALFNLGARLRLNLSERREGVRARPDLAEVVRRELAAVADDIESPANDASTRKQLAALQRALCPKPVDTSSLLRPWDREKYMEDLLQGALVVGCGFPPQFEDSDDRLQTLARDLCWGLWWPLPRALLGQEDELEFETREALQRAIAAEHPPKARIQIARLAGQYVQGRGAFDTEDPFPANLAGLLLATLARMDLREEGYRPSVYDGFRSDEPPIPPGTARAELRRWITWHMLSPDVREVMRGVALENSGHEDDFCNRVIAIRDVLYRERRERLFREAVRQQGGTAVSGHHPTAGPGDSGESGDSTPHTNAGARAHAPAGAAGAGLETPDSPHSPAGGETQHARSGTGRGASDGPTDARRRLIAAENFEWIEDGETRYVFRKPQERAAVRVLWEAEGRPVHEDTIRDRIGAEDVDRFRLRNVFRRNNELNAAWGTLIQNTGQRSRMYVLPR